MRENFIRFIYVLPPNFVDDNLFSFPPILTCENKFIEFSLPYLPLKVFLHNGFAVNIDNT